MIIYSEVLDQKFNSVNECLAAEKEFFKKKEAEKAEKAKALEKEKRETEAYERLMEAWKNYQEVMEIPTYGREVTPADINAFMLIADIIESLGEWNV